MPFANISNPSATGASVSVIGPLGQAAMAASIPVVIASNQSAVPATLRSNYSADAVAPASVDEVGLAVLDTSGVATTNRLRTAASIANGDAGTATLSVLESLFTGAAYNPRRTAAAADGTGGQGVAAVGPLLYDGATFSNRQTSLTAVGSGIGIALASPPSSTPVAVTAAATVAGVITIAGVAGQRIRLTYLNLSYSGTLAGAKIATVADGTTTYNFPISVVGEAVEISGVSGGIAFAVGATVTITIPADATAANQINAAYFIT